MMKNRLNLGGVIGFTLALLLLSVFQRDVITQVGCALFDSGGRCNVTGAGGLFPATQSGTWDEVGINDSGNSLTVDGTVTANIATAGTAVTSGTEGAYQALDIRMINPATNAPVEFSGSCTPSFLKSAASVNETAIKATAGYIDMLAGWTIDATTVYLKLYNDTMANIDETDTPTWVFPISSAEGGFILPIPAGAVFSTAITFRLTTGAANNSTGAVSADEVFVNWCFR